MQRLLKLTLTFGLALIPAAATAQQKGPPYADKEVKKAKPKPKERAVTIQSETPDGRFSFDFRFVPGIPDPNKTAEIIITANEVPPTPHPRFGSRVPLANARLFVEVMSPTGESVAKYVAHPMPLARGKYGLHITPTQSGIFTLSLQGKTAKGKALAGEVKLPVDVWPLPEELEKQERESAHSGRRRPVVGK